MKQLQETGVYVHIPFCSGKCNYCDFLSAPGSEEEMESYVDLLSREAACHRSRFTARTVFVGGGTPSILPDRLLTRLIEQVVAPFARPDGPIEFTVECNPESFSPATARLLRRLGADRLSLGLQSFVENDLRGLGRRHTVRQALEAYELAREAGFASVNLDLMYGFPGHTERAWEASLERAVTLAPEHVSAYCFILEEGTRFWPAHEAGELPDEDGDLQASMYDRCRQVLADRGYRHYEISNFALPGHECRHNLRYWRNESYLGLGLGAVSFQDGHRRGNARTMPAYRSQVEEGRPWDWIEDALSPNARVRESLILGLRLLEGVDPRTVPGNPLAEHEHEEIGRVLDRWQARGLVARCDDRYALTERGLFLSNEVFADLVA